MASSSNRKSSSSASRAPKPTFRRASGSSARSAEAGFAAASRADRSREQFGGLGSGGAGRAGSYQVPSPRPKRSARPQPRGQGLSPQRAALSRAQGIPSRSRGIAPGAMRSSAMAPSGSARPPRPVARPVSEGRQRAAEQRRFASAVPAARQPRPVSRAVSRSQARPRVQAGSSLRAPRPQQLAAPPRRTFTSVSAPSARAPRPTRRGAPGAVASAFGIVAGAFGATFGAIGSILALVPHPKLPAAARRAVIGVAAGAAVLAIAFLVVANSGVFAATDVRIDAGEHVSAAELETLLELPAGTTLLNADASAITKSLQKSPWIAGVDIERSFPHTLVITPRERTLSAIAYISADNVAWAVSSDGTWIAPVTLSVTVDEQGNVVDDPSKLAEGAKTSQLAGEDAALALARQSGAVLLTEVSADVSPVSGDAVTSKVVKAGLSYATGFSASFLKQVKDIAIPSEDAVSANLEDGVEVSLGKPEDIQRKEQVVTKVLEQVKGVTYINVRTPDAYTYRAADASS